MKARFLALGIAIGVVLTLTLGFAYGGSGSMMNGFSGRDMRAAMEAMHESPQMRAMHERMPEELQAQCDAMHERMLSSGMIGPGGMMGSGGMMGG